MANGRDNLRADLQADLLKTQQAVQETGSRLGISTPQAPQTQPGSFGFKGIKIGDKIIAREHVHKTNLAVQNAINRLVKESGFVDNISSNAARDVISEKINNIQLDFSRRAVELDKRLDKSMVKAKERAQLFQTLGSLAGLSARAAIGGM